MAHYRLGIVCAILAITFYSTFLLAPEFVREIGKCEAVEAGFLAKAWKTIGQVLASGQQRPGGELSVGKQWLCSGRNITDSTEQWVRPYASLRLYHVWCISLITFFVLISPELVALVQVTGLIILLPLRWIIRILVFVYRNYPSIRASMSTICRSALKYVKNKYSTIKHNGVQFPTLSLVPAVHAHDDDRKSERNGLETDMVNRGLDQVDVVDDGMQETAAFLSSIESHHCDFQSVQSHLDAAQESWLVDSRSTLHHCEDIVNESMDVQGGITASGSNTEEEHYDVTPLPSDTIASLSVSVLSELEDPHSEVAVFSHELDLHLDAYLSDSQHSGSHATEPFTSVSTLADSGIEASPFMSITNYGDAMVVGPVQIPAGIEGNVEMHNEVPSTEQGVLEEEYYDQDGTGSWVESRSVSSTTIDSASFLEVLGLLTSHAMKEEDETSHDVPPVTSSDCTSRLVNTLTTHAGNVELLDGGSASTAERCTDSNAQINVVPGTVCADQSDKVPARPEELSHDFTRLDGDANDPAQEEHGKQCNADPVNHNAGNDRKLCNQEDNPDTLLMTKEGRRVDQIHLSANSHDLTQEEVRKRKRFLSKRKVAKLVDRFSHFIHEHGQADEQMKKSLQRVMGGEKSTGMIAQNTDNDGSTSQNSEKSQKAMQFWLDHQEQTNETLAQNIQFEKAGCRLESTSSTISNALMSLFNTPQVERHEERSKPRQFIDAVESLKKTLTTQDSPNAYKSPTLEMESSKPVQFTSALDALGLDKAKLVRPKVVRIQSQFANAVDSLMKSIDRTELHTLQKKRQSRRRAAATKPSGNTTSVDELFHNITNKIEERQQRQISDKVNENADDCGDNESNLSALQKPATESVGKECDDVESILKPLSPSVNKEEENTDASAERSQSDNQFCGLPILGVNLAEKSTDHITSDQACLGTEKTIILQGQSDQLNSDVKSENASATDVPFVCGARMIHSMKAMKSWRYSTSRPRKIVDTSHQLTSTRAGVMSLVGSDTQSGETFTSSSTDKNVDEIEIKESSQMVRDFSGRCQTGSSRTSLIYLNKTSAERGYYEAASCVSELSCARTIQVDPREMMAMSTVTFSQSEESLMQQPFHYDINWEERAIEKMADK